LKKLICASALRTIGVLNHAWAQPEVPTDFLMLSLLEGKISCRFKQVMSLAVVTYRAVIVFVIGVPLRLAPADIRSIALHPTAPARPVERLVKAICSGANNGPPVRSSIIAPSTFIDASLSVDANALIASDRLLGLMTSPAAYD
jgi:hypothetical protein